LWVLNAPLLIEELSAGGPATHNQLVAGGCIVTLATMRFIFVREAGVFRWAHLLLGLWTIASPWVFGYVSDDMAFWNSAVSGMLVAMLAMWSLIR
jgi:hypothetical protein